MNLCLKYYESEKKFGILMVGTFMKNSKNDKFFRVNELLGMGTWKIDGLF